MQMMVTWMRSWQNSSKNCEGEEVEKLKAEKRKTIHLIMMMMIIVVVLMVVSTAISKNVWIVMVVILDIDISSIVLLVDE